MAIHKITIIDAGLLMKYLQVEQQSLYIILQVKL